MDPALINFKVLYVLTQLCGLTMIVLVGTWIGQHFGGLGGTSNPGLEFNWHPLFMTIGFIYLYGNCEYICSGRGATPLHSQSMIFKMLIPTHSHSDLSWLPHHAQEDSEAHPRWNPHCRFYSDGDCAEDGLRFPQLGQSAHPQYVLPTLLAGSFGGDHLLAAVCGRICGLFGTWSKGKLQDCHDAAAHLLRSLRLCAGHRECPDGHHREGHLRNVSLDQAKKYHLTNPYLFPQQKSGVFHFATSWCAGQCDRSALCGLWGPGCLPGH